MPEETRVVKGASGREYIARKIVAQYPGACGKCGGELKGTPIWYAKGLQINHVACPPRVPAQATLTEIWNSPPRSTVVFYKPTIGEPLMAGDHAEVVAKRRWVSAEEAEDFDWFDIANRGGAWEIWTRPAQTEAERAACQALEEGARAEQVRAEAERQRKVTEAAVAQIRRKTDETRLGEVLAAIPTDYQQTDYDDCDEIGYVNEPGKWDVIFSSPTAGWSSGSVIYHHKTLPVYRHAFGNRCVAYAPPEYVERWLRKAVAKFGLTREKAEAWLQDYRGCVGTELYEFAAQLET